jgi:hypothetical protein
MAYEAIDRHVLHAEGSRRRSAGLTAISRRRASVVARFDCARVAAFVNPPGVVCRR